MRVCNPRGLWTTSHLRDLWDVCAESAEAPASLQRPGPRTRRDRESRCGTARNPGDGVSSSAL